MTLFLDKSYPTKIRVEHLLKQMTLKEKVGQLNQHLYGWQCYKKYDSTFELTNLFKNEVAKWGGIGALYGLFRADPWSKKTYKNGINALDSPKVANKIQDYIEKHTRLKIPALLSEECPHGHQALDGTVIPTNIGSGSTWNPELMQDIYSDIAREIRKRGAHLGLISTLDIARDPRWGRTEESFGEDPCLAAKMTEAAVKGFQGTHSESLSSMHQIGAVLKHFSAQGSGEGGINAAPASIGLRELHDIHLPGMKAGSKAGAVGCMAAYNEIDGIPCHASEYLLNDVLRKQLGFNGVVMADGVAIDRLNILTGSFEKSATTALKAGVDLSLWDTSFTRLEDAVKAHLLDERVIDKAVSRILTLKFEFGLFESRYIDEPISIETVIHPKTKDKNLKVAEESLVLLKNNDILPLDSSIKNIALIGPNADSVYNLLGDYTATQQDGKVKSIYEALQIANPKATITYSKGCGILDQSKDGFTEALAAAEAADLVILAVGGSSSRDFNLTFDKNGAALPNDQPVDMDCGEGMDVADLRLGGVQEELIEAIKKLNKPTVGLLVQGRPYAVEGLSTACDALLCCWYPGAEGGEAIARTLLGHNVPSGKLPISIPRSTSQLPVYYNKKDLGQQLHYHDITTSPLYPFGYGLSYTTFKLRIDEISNESISIRELEQGNKVFIKTSIENIGKVSGSEVIQLYRHDQQSSITPRIKELKAFKKIFLKPSEKITYTFTLDKEDMCTWNKDLAYVLEPKVIQWYVGNSSLASQSVLLTIY
ncbi:glycoside hydrolase family 3 N-terminal domain-containing protein [Amphibacillus jilinensis]|uniref:glycoside hydrolase family 3 N-terminal domain-containing protein n=1 Tax=Amphibacillus jilinensis TaxID=1216008 RepID=UPI0002F5827B|nr:glycoside hydrolase family 3 N-terminal domain-containing protein [Amphibacillus jilinensis]